MKAVLKKSGFSILQLLVTLAVGAIMAVNAGRAFAALQGLMNRSTVKQQNSLLSKDIQLRLQKILGGTRSLQNLSFRVPGSGTPGLQSIGSGIYVDPDKSFTGQRFVGIDRMYVVQKRVATEGILLGTPVANPLPINLSIPIKIDSSFFDPGSYFIISMGRRTSIFRLSSAVAFNSSSTIPVSLNLPMDLNSANSPAYLDPETHLATQPSLTYRPGDRLIKADIFLIGYDPEAKKLFSKNIRTEGTNTIADGVDFFSVAYSMGNCTVGAITVSTGVNEFARDGWTTLNLDPTCYLKLRAIQIKYKVNSANIQTIEFPMN